jgi:hypothetical protein
MSNYKYTLQKTVEVTVLFDSEELGKADPDMYAAELAQEEENQRPEEILCEEDWQISCGGCDD